MLFNNLRKTTDNSSWIFNLLKLRFCYYHQISDENQSIIKKKNLFTIIFSAKPQKSEVFASFKQLSITIAIYKSMKILWNK